MSRPKFHHPHVSFTILRRQVSAELIDLTCLLTEVLSTGGRAALWNRSFPHCTSYHMAARRLQKAGIIAYRRTGGHAPELKLTPAGQAQVSEFIVPERFWNRRWTGVWYLLMYDIPEIQRRYRSALWHFLARLRLGRLQKSVWISARDIRPLFYDLKEAAAINEYACIFAAKTVLGQPNSEVAAQAWDFDRLNAIHARYIETVGQRLAKKNNVKGPMQILAMLRSELAEYIEAMRLDPLLPSILWPTGYQGPKVAAVFRRRMRQIAAPGLYK